MKVSLIVTVLNEEKTITQLLSAIEKQSRHADEVIIVDGGSRDDTQLLVTQFAQTHPELKIQLLQKKGNRSVGRNAAIFAARYPWIAVTDAGCVPHEDWLEKLVARAEKIKEIDFVIAGYYDARPRTPFEEAVVPYVLVMPDRVDSNHFLPATRSMLMTKSIWEKFGRFNEHLNDNEDYAFSLNLLRSKVPMYFAQNAKVTWLPRQTLEQFLHMIFRFARGDIYAGILRVKVVLLFVRYVAALMFTVFVFWQHSLLWWTVWATLVVAYLCLWPIAKNHRYVPRGWYWLPVLQFVADIGVLSGSMAGLVQKL